MIIKVDNKWINPDHVVSLEPSGGRTLVHLSTGKYLEIYDRTPRQVAHEINAAIMPPPPSSDVEINRHLMNLD